MADEKEKGKLVKKVEEKEHSLVVYEKELHSLQAEDKTIFEKYGISVFKGQKVLSSEREVKQEAALEEGGINSSSEKGSVNLETAGQFSSDNSDNLSKHSNTGASNPSLSESSSGLPLPWEISDKDHSGQKKIAGQPMEKNEKEGREEEERKYLQKEQEYVESFLRVSLNQNIAITGELPEIRPGQILLEQYKVQSPLGAGGMGSVWLVEDQNSGASFAMKVTLIPQNLVKFCKEAEIWIALGLHPNVVSAYFLENYENTVLLFLEYIPGETLEKWQQKSHSEEEKLKIALQICWGMAYTHECSLLHRDLKPSNILITQDEKTHEDIAKITDFGLGRMLGEKEHLGKFLGTLNYMPPEQFDSANKANKRSDMYSFGVMFYRLMAGKHPYLEKFYQEWNKKVPDHLTISEKNIWEKIIWEEIHKTYHPDFSIFLKELQDILQSCMAKNKEQRPFAFAEIAKGIADILNKKTGRDFSAPEKIIEIMQPHLVNNKAVSLLRLGKLLKNSNYSKDAENLLQKVSTAKSWIIKYNWALYQLRQGKMTLSNFFKNTKTNNVIDAAIARANVCLEFGGLISEVFSELNDYYNQYNTNGHLISAIAMIFYRGREWNKCQNYLEKIPKELRSPKDWCYLGAAIWEQNLKESALSIWEEGSKCYPDDSTLNNLKQLGRSAKTSDTFFSQNKKIFWSELCSKSFDVMKKLGFWEPNVERLSATETYQDGIFAGIASVHQVATVTPDSKFYISAREDDFFLFSMDNFSAPAKLISKLRDATQKSDPVSLYLKGKFSGQFQKKINAYREEEGLSKDFLDTLVKEFNRLLQKTSYQRVLLDALYSKFKKLSEETRMRILSHPSLERLKGETRLRFNRLLLEETYPDEITKSREDTTLRIWKLSKFPKPLQFLQRFLQCMWDITIIQKRFCILKGHTDKVSAIAITSDSKFCISASKDKTIRIWEIASGTCKIILSGHTDEVSAIAITSDSKLCISASKDKTIRIWEIASGTCLQILQKSPLCPPTEYNNWEDLWRYYRLDKLLITSDSRFFLSENFAILPIRNTPYYPRLCDNRVKILCIWECISYRLYPGEVTGDYLVMQPISAKQALKEQENLHELQGKIQSCFIKGDFTSIPALYRSIPDLGCSCPHSSLDQILEAMQLLWRPFDYFDCIFLESEFIAHTDRICGISITPNSRFFISFSKDNTIRIWDIFKRCLLHTLQYKTNIIAVTPDSQFFISAQDNSLCVWDILSGDCTKELKGHSDKIRTIVITPDSRLCISTASKELGIWEIETGKCCLLTGYTNVINSVTVTPDSQFCIFTCGDGTLNIWNIKEKNCLKVKVINTNTVSKVAVTSDGLYAISANSSEISIWENSSYQLIHELPDRHNRILRGALAYSSINEEWKYMLDYNLDTALAITPDSKLCLAPLQHFYTEAIKDLQMEDQIGRLGVWEIASGAFLGIMEKQPRLVDTVRMTPDSQICLFVGRDTRLFVSDFKSSSWNRNDIIQAIAVEGHNDIIETIAVAQNGLYAISGSGDATIRLWRLARGWKLENRQEHNPNQSHIVSLENMMQEYKKQRNWPAAHNLGRQILYLNPNLPDAQYNYGLCLYQLSQSARDSKERENYSMLSRAHFQRALQLRPGWTQAQEFLNKAQENFSK